MGLAAFSGVLFMVEESRGSPEVRVGAVVMGRGGWCKVTKSEACWQRIILPLCDRGQTLGLNLLEYGGDVSHLPRELFTGT